LEEDVIQIDPQLVDLLEDETKAYAILATVMPDGSPQATPVWFNTDGEYILINSAKGRVKDINMRARPAVAVTILDTRNPDQYVQLRGMVEEIIEEGALEHIKLLAAKYNAPSFSVPADQIRVIYKIKPK
jgi:PPOX class probable F420-dependent enzyme